MAGFGNRDRYGRVLVLLEPEEAQLLLDNADKVAKLKGEDTEYQIDEESFKGRMKRAASGEGAPNVAAGNTGGTRTAGEEFKRGY